jgi:hypothetical protein
MLYCVLVPRRLNPSAGRRLALGSGMPAHLAMSPGQRHAANDSPTLGQIHAHNEPALVRHRVASYACGERHGVGWVSVCVEAFEKFSYVSSYRVHEISHAFPKLEIRSLLVRARCGSGATRVAEHVARVGTPVRPARQTPPYLLPRLKARLLVYWACLYERAVIRKPRRRLLGPSTPP